MKTFEEINEIAPYHPLEWQQGYGIWQAGYMQGQKDGTAEQKAIDDAELHQRFEKVLNGQKWDLIDDLLQYLEELEAHYRDLGQYDDGKPIRRVIEYIKAIEDNHFREATKKVIDKAIDDAENGKALLYAVNKTTERVKREMINKACEWLEMHIEYWLYDDGFLDVNAMLKDFRKAMNDENY